MLRRNLERRVVEALGDTPIVFLQGPRQAGKSTLVRDLCAGKARRYLTLDDATALAAARRDPVGFLAGMDGPVALDEVQRAPELFLAIKASVDRDRRPGRFLLTGSASILVVPELADALAGRMEVLALHPFSEGEIAEVEEAPISTIFSDELPPVRSEPRAAILERVLRGGFPEVVARSATRRPAWFESYVLTVLQREVRDLANVADLSVLPRLLALLAARSATLMNATEIAASLGIPLTTVRRYLALLQGTFLSTTVSAWASNRGQRLVKTPKVYLQDSGLAAHLLGLEKEVPDALIGPLLETFVLGQLTRSAGWSSPRVRIHHFRTHTGREVDFVLEDPRGRLVGVEVKAVASVSARDLGGLTALGEAAGTKFHRGVVLYTGDEVVAFGEKLHAVPLAALWHWTR